MKLILPKSEEFWIVVVALLVAWLLAADQSAYYSTLGVFSSYLYWTVRILIETATFIAFLYAIENYLQQHLPIWGSYILAVLLSLIPFTLAITALDIIIGLPELGINDINAPPVARGWEFGLELFYLLDNHIILCTLLLLPRLLLSVNSQVEAEETTDTNIANTEESAMQYSSDIPPTFLDSLEPPLDGHICSMEAQEHYILVTTTATSRMVLHRFSDAVQHTPAALGMKVHRSHWVAHSAVKEIVVEGQSMKLKLNDGQMIPVSRTFRAAVESRYSQA